MGKNFSVQSFFNRINGIVFYINIIFIPFIYFNKPNEEELNNYGFIFILVLWISFFLEKKENESFTLLRKRIHLLIGLIITGIILYNMFNYDPTRIISNNWEIKIFLICIFSFLILPMIFFTLDGYLNWTYQFILNQKKRKQQKIEQQKIIKEDKIVKSKDHGDSKLVPIIILILIIFSIFLFSRSKERPEFYYEDNNYRRDGRRR